MQFFKELFIMSEGLDLTIKVKRVGEKLTISILPDMTEGVEPLLMTGTWEEFDTEFFNYVKPSMDTARVVMNNVHDFEKQMKELGENKKKEVEEKKSEPAKTSPPAKKGVQNTKKIVEGKKTVPAKTSPPLKEGSAADIEDDDDVPLEDKPELSPAPKPVEKKEEPAGPKQLSII